MAGHSKWANIKHRKGMQDARRGRIFSKLSKELTVAALKGSDPAMNPALRLAISKAKANSMPKKTIANAIAKATSNATNVNFKELLYGANIIGISLLIVCLTDNVNRTPSDIQHLVSRFNGMLSSSSSVAYVFDRAGILEFDASDHDEDKLLDQTINLGAKDFESTNGTFRVYTTPQTFSTVKNGLEASGITNFTKAEVCYFAHQEMMVSKAKAERVINLIEALEENDDVQNVYHNLDLDSLDQN